MQSQTDVIEILARVKGQLSSRGAKTIRGLGRTFRALDSFDGNKKIDREEFLVGLRENGAELTKPEAELLFDFFDKDRDGSVNFDGFLVGIRGKPNKRRQAMIDKAFLKFDKDGNGYIDANDLKGTYNASMHPKV